MVGADVVVMAVTTGPGLTSGALMEGGGGRSSLLCTAGREGRAGSRMKEGN